MTMRFSTVCAALALATAAAPAPALAFTLADAPERQTPAEIAAAHAADRAEILAMAGDYRVRFDMRETTPWRAGYVPIDAKLSGGHESVRVIEDSPDRIVLQHLLVVEHEGQSHVVKHWRQDWDYQPARVLAYAGPGRWQWEAVPAALRAGRWAQTVWQVDDSPRYAGWGRFETQGGMRRWQSNRTWRPLARRDAVRRPVYDRYLSVNRHQPTPDGWVHWQDNIKMGTVDGRLVPIVQEAVVNSYTRFDDYDVRAADDYWARTSGYWAAVRAAWSRVAERDGGISVREEAETGTVISARLLALADEIRSGATTDAAAEAEAVRLIETAGSRE